MKTIINVTLKKDLPVLLETNNIVSIKKNEFDLSSRFAIDITEREPVSVSTYVYNSESDRDKDFANVERIIKESESNG